MKNISLIVNAVLAVALIVIYVLFFSSKNGKSETTDSAVPSPTDLNIAYVKVDSLILNYDLAQELHDSFTKNQEAYTKEYTRRRTKFEQDASDFQGKVQRGGFITEQRALQERDRLVSEEQQIAKLDQELSNKLAELQNANNKTLRDSLMNCLTQFNSDKKYSYIFDASAILIGDEMTNITNDILQALNKRYADKKK